MSSADILEPRAVTRDLFSASIGSVLCAYTGQPLDTVKVKQQTNPEQFTNVLSTTKLIYQNEGIAAFWKGAVPTAGECSSILLLLFRIFDNCLACCAKTNAH